MGIYNILGLSINPHKSLSKLSAIYGDLSLTLFHMIEVFKDLIKNLVIIPSCVSGRGYKSLLCPLCEYVEENALGSLKTAVCVSVSNFVHVK